MPRRKLRILFASSEVDPFIKTGGLADVALALPKAMVKLGCDIRVIMPKYQTIPENYQVKMKHLTTFTVPLGWRQQYCGVDKMVLDNITYYFIDNEYYFKRDKIYGHYDDGERFAFYAKAICTSLAYLDDFKCDIIHCNDWHTALVPVYLRECFKDDPLYANIKTIFTVHNTKFQGIYSDYMLNDVLGLHCFKAAVDQLYHKYNAINYMKGALSYSDLITTVSPSYAEEIKTKTFGEGLDEIFSRRHQVLHGIINGIDNDQYDPATDKLIIQPFTIDTIDQKYKNRQTIREELGLDINTNDPLVIIISRLSEQKGMELIKHVMREIVALPIQLVVLGTGDKEYEDMFRYWANLYHNKMVACITFDSALSHRLYAGADLLLMPSQFEPCGLSQMIAMRYGVLPVVREVGGLKDSVIAYDRFTKTGNGFSFANYNAHEFLFTLTNAVDIYHNNHDDWNILVTNAMATDFSWEKSARQYLSLYQSLKPEVYGYFK